MKLSMRRSLRWSGGVMNKRGCCCALSLLLLVSGISVAGSLKDPTRPAGYMGIEPAALTNESGISAILVSPTRRVAVIYGRFVQKGDVVDGAVVERITDNSVVFSRDGKQYSKMLVPSILQATS